ncbi:hypothetical protein FACS1894184_03320 [Clostridia bacterium]|nr:hypothetical protein FACS1894184_03320 [Clostridia bacterium]
MNILIELTVLLQGLGLRVETCTFSEPPPETYTVITPLADTFELHADNHPTLDVQEARISLFCKSSYTSHKNAITRAALAAGFIVTSRQFIEKESDTNFYHYSIDVTKHYVWEDVIYGDNRVG